MAFTCPECGDQFSRADSMKRHQKRAHEKKPENCKPLQHPFGMLVAGPSSSGKTWWIQQLLQNKFIEPMPTHFVWCYAQWQPLYDQLLEQFPMMEYVKGIPDDIMSRWNPQNTNLLIIDDLMAQMDDKVSQLYVQGSHHLNLSVITVLQNLFPKGRDPRTVSLNSQYILLLKNPRDCLQVATLGSQMYPGNGKKLVTAYREATKRPYSYLLVDLKQNTPEECRLRTNLFETKQDEPKPTEKHARATSEQMVTQPPNKKTKLHVSSRATSEQMVTQPPNEKTKLHVSSRASSEQMETQSSDEKTTKLGVSSRAQELLQLFKPNLLDWNNHDEVVVHGRPVKGSNLTELVEYSVSPRGDPPMGWNDFLRGLKLHKSRLIALSLPEVTGGDIVLELSPIVQKVADWILCHVGPDLLAWDKYRTAHLMGKVVPESNIVDLFKFVLSPKAKEPIGLIEFIKALKAGKVTRDLLVNHQAVEIYDKI